MLARAATPAEAESADSNSKQPWRKRPVAPAPQLTVLCASRARRAGNRESNLENLPKQPRGGGGSARKRPPKAAAEKRIHWKQHGGRAPKTPSERPKIPPARNAIKQRLHLDPPRAAQRTHFLEEKDYIQCSVNLPKISSEIHQVIIFELQNWRLMPSSPRAGPGRSRSRAGRSRSPRAPGRTRAASGLFI